MFARNSQVLSLSAAALVFASFGCKKTPQEAPEDPAIYANSPAATLSATLYPGEWRLTNLRRLTSGGENAEAYWSADGKEIIFQSTREGLGCDQIFRMDQYGNNQRMVSTGKGRTTCSFLLPDGSGFVYSSSHEGETECPAPVDHSRGYVWPLNQHMEIYKVGPEGENPVVLAPFEGYDAEAVVSPQGDRIIFTSTRSGDVDIWSMDINGGDIKQLTDGVGYDGGAFFSRDGKHIVWRSHYPTGPALEDYKSLLADNLVRPSVMNLMIMDADGSNKRQILANGAANFAPYFHPDGKRIIFSSNMDSASGRDFDLYIINIDGSGLERVTYYEDFDSFPMFSYDGTKVIFSSNRDGGEEGETNVFVADWNDAPPAQIEETTGKPEIDRIFGDIEVLASAEYGGRGLGTEGLELAAKFLETRLGELGLQPAGENGTFRDSFNVAVKGVLQSASLSVNGKAVPAEGFRPFSFSASGNVEADALYLGYGIKSDDHQYNDYAGAHGDIDVTGKVVVIHRFEPQRHDPASRFGGVQPIQASDLRFKVMEAKHRGAAAVVIVNPTVQGTEDDSLMRFGSSPSDLGIPVIHLSSSAAEAAFGPRLQQMAAAIDESGQPASGAPLGKIKLSVEITREQATIANIVGLIPANEKIDDQLIVIGAHYDHLGMGGESSTRPNLDEIHPGADDNASGTAAVLEIARLAKSAKLGRDIAVVFFTAEESGLLGSAHFVSNGPLKERKIAAMLNLDMVGMLRDNALTVSGTASGKQMAEVARRAQSGLGLNLTLDKSGHGASDHMSFYLQQIPVLALFTGTHEHYHNPDDVPANLQKDGLVTVTTYGLRALVDLANLAIAPEYIAPRAPRGGGDRGGSGSRGYGPSFGSIPAFGETPGGGVRVSGARPGSPAEQAGLQADDVIIRFAGVDVTGLEDYTFALRQQKPGAEVEFTVRRNGEEVNLKATLGGN